MDPPPKKKQQHKNKQTKKNPNTFSKMLTHHMSQEQIHSILAISQVPRALLVGRYTFPLNYIPKTLSLVLDLCQVTQLDFVCKFWSKTCSVI